MMHLNRYTIPVWLLLFLASPFSASYGEPIVIKGRTVKKLLGSSINSIRLSNRDLKSVIFQIDEMSSDGEYVCPQGEEPNISSGNGILDPQDEIVFLWEDCQPFVAENEGDTSENTIRLKIQGINETREIYISKNSSLPLSNKRYINYQHENRMLKTPWYYAELGKNRFHFVRAGVKDFITEKYVDLTDELRIEIFLRALWGLIPIHYTEDNMVCLVKRYKCGPLRLIRRGDFHLNLGLGLRGSRAVVNQICYPQIIKVPVYVHAPVRFGSFFRDAYIEMTPVIKDVPGFSFRVPKADFSNEISGNSVIDTLMEVAPNNQFMSVTDGQKGYGWVLQAKIPDQYLQTSGFVYRKPSLRSGSADCGFRLNIRNLPKGYYEITNWVLFQSSNFSQFSKEFNSVLRPVTIHSPDGEFPNELSASSVTKN